MAVSKILGKKLRRIRLDKGLTQMQVSKVLGNRNATYVSDAELGAFVPQPDKLRKWAKALGMTQAEMDDLHVEAKLEDIGLSDPGFTLMFKEVPNMTAPEHDGRRKRIDYQFLRSSH